MAKTDLAKIDADLAERAKRIKEQIGSSDSRRLTVDQKEGAFIGPGGLNMGDELKVVVVDFCTYKRYYDRTYNQANPMPPACVAIGDVLSEMTPEEGVPAPQSDLCKDCWANQWESGNGRGKACKDARELAVVLADELEDDEIEPEMYVLSCSPTSIKSFDAAAAKIYQIYNGTPIKAVMTMRVKATDNFYNVQFGDIEPNQHLVKVYPLLQKTADLLGRLPDFSTYEPPKQFPPKDVRNQQTQAPSGRRR